MIRFTQVEAWDCFAYEHLIFNFEEGIHSIEGLNGSAKTSIFMVLEQGLFNRNSKGTRIDEVNNTITGKPYEIKITLLKNADEYIIINSRKSGTIEIYKNGKPKHVKRIPDNLKIIEDILGADFNMFQDLIYQSPKSSINLLENYSDASRKAFVNNILNLDELDAALEKFKARDKELSGKSGQIELLRNQIRRHEESIVEDYEIEQDEILVAPVEKLIEDLSISMDNRKTELVKTRTTLETLREELNRCESAKATKIRIAELNEYLSKIKLDKTTSKELAEIKSSIRLELQELKRAISDTEEALTVIEYNSNLEHQKIELISQLNSLVVPSSTSEIVHKLNDLVKSQIKLETEIKSNEDVLTELVEYSTMGTCPTCSQAIDKDTLAVKIALQKQELQKNKAALVDQKVLVNMYEQYHKEALIIDSIKNKLNLIEAKIKPCKQSKKEAEESLTVLKLSLESKEQELVTASRRLESKLVFEEAVAELDKLKATSGVAVNAVEVEEQIEKLTDFCRALRVSLEEIDEQIKEAKTKLKTYSEFNTVQRTIKAVNAQKRSYNDATRVKLDELYKELSNAEDTAALVKTWVQILGPKGFRVHKMQSFLGHLNSAMKKYSDMLSDGKIRCMFFMSEGEIDFTVTDCNKTIAWSCWSEGEKARVKMACLFAVLELLEVMGAVSFNVLALDEIFSALDHAGKEGLFRVLNYLKNRGRAIYTIAHTQLALDKEYDSVIKACKQEDGTTTITQ